MEQFKQSDSWKTTSMPSPTLEEIQHPAFQTVYQAIKTWDINVPEGCGGYCGANGSHVKVILDALWEAAYPGQPHFEQGKIVNGLVYKDSLASDGRDWPTMLGYGPFVTWRYYVQRCVEAWLCLTGRWSLHKAWQNGMRHGCIHEYYRTKVMRGG